jgi:two-component system CheB/CheR fusion protein
MTRAGVDGGFEDYLDHLQVHPDAAAELFNTVFINVTGFFRDAETWEQLRLKIVPELLARKPAEPIRVWSAGCATGQEAYSIAIVLAEMLGIDEFRGRVKIYATDVDPGALAQARTAVYSTREQEGLSAEQLERYFEPTEDGRAAFRKDLRRSVIFGRNDLVQDAPISRIDLLACRNTLMYFNAETQARILARFHFALNPGGFLLLGKAETLLTHGGIFTPADLERRFFRKLGPEAREDRRMLLAPRRHTGGADEESRLRWEAMRAGALAQLTVDRAGRLALSNARADALFGLGPDDLGRPFQDLDVSFRPVELRSSIVQVRSDLRPLELCGIEWTRAEDGGAQVLDIEVTPLLDADRTFLGATLTFHDVSRFRRLEAELHDAHQRLEAAYQELQSANEELETTNEELQCTVEELETTNEELQSTNEELETMNSELQAINDELQASGAEQRSRTAQVDDLNTFMESVLMSLRGGVVVLDDDLHVQMWNRRSEELWGVRQDEALGRRFDALDIGLPVADLVPYLTALVTGAGSADGGIVTEAVNRRGRPITVRVSGTPMRGTDGSTGAIVVVEEAGQSLDGMRPDQPAAG